LMPAGPGPWAADELAEDTSSSSGAYTPCQSVSRYKSLRVIADIAYFRKRHRLDVSLAKARQGHSPRNLANLSAGTKAYAWFTRLPSMLFDAAVAMPNRVSSPMRLS